MDRTIINKKEKNKLKNTNETNEERQFQAGIKKLTKELNLPDLKKKMILLSAEFGVLLIKELKI